MDRIQNEMRRQAEGVAAGFAFDKIALIDDYDPQTYRVQVVLQPSGVKLSWIPLLTEWAGAGWGMVSPPSVGDQVLVVHQEGSHQVPFVAKRFFDAQNTPPTGCPSGEFWLVHKSGSVIKIHNDGSIEIQTHTNLNVTATQGVNITANAGNGTVAITGNVTVSGTIAAQGNISSANGTITSKGSVTSTNGDVSDQHGSIQQMRTIYDSHVHPGVQTGPGSTGATTQVM